MALPDVQSLFGSMFGRMWQIHRAGAARRCGLVNRCSRFADFDPEQHQIDSSGRIGSIGGDGMKPTLRRRGRCLRRALGACHAWIVIGLLLSAPVAAAPSDVPGWSAARWGMTEAELKTAIPKGLTKLPGRWQYGKTYADYAVLGTRLGGLAFNAFFQMNNKTDRLEQVLLERRRPQATPAAFYRLLDALEEAYGPPTETCEQAKTGGTPLRYALIWRFPTTTLRASFLDFSSTAVFHRDPNAPIDPLRSFRDDRRNNFRFVPRRILIRLHPTDRTAAAENCP